MRKFAVAVVVGFVLLLTPAFAASASDISGKWTGNFIITGPNGDTRDESAYMDFKQTGAELTGTAGPNADKQFTILKGKVDGNKVTFEVQTERPLIKFELTLIDGNLKGEAKVDIDGETRKATINLQRAAK